MTPEEIRQAEDETGSIILLIPAIMSRKDYDAGDPDLLPTFFKNILETHIYLFEQNLKEKGWTK